ncbi:MAG TPA: DNA primase, partial [Sphingomicrobium sp.]|nr:DNA primase [Sphingomicrobium sp.]
RDAAPLATPEARAGFRQRLVEHAQAIGDPELRRLYRDQWLTRFNEEFGAARRHQQYRGRQPNRFDRKTGRWVPPAQPASDTARRIASCGIDTSTARALVLGFALYPQALHDHLEQLAHLPINERPLSALRDRIVDTALAGEALDRQKLATILETAGAGAALERARLAGGIGFSFTRSDTDPERAVRDLGVAIDALAAEEEIGAALIRATERLQAGESDAFDEQRRLHDAREEIKQRLAALVGSG